MVELAKIYKPIENELIQVEKRIDEKLRISDKFITSLSDFIRQSPGKRLRPALVLLAAKSRPANMTKAIDLAAAVELIHTATLVHDDVVDKAMLRRRQMSVNQKFGKEAALLFGDYLYSRAFEIISGIDISEITRTILRATNTICQGELRQLSLVFKSIKEREYLKIISDKTASFFSACCESGGQVAQVDKKTVELLGEYGYNLGVSFQIMDDCLDLTSNERKTGKTTQLDAKSGKMTLPHIYLRHYPNKTISQATDYSRDLANQYGAKAITALTGLNDQGIRTTFTDLVKYVLNRVN